MKKVLVVVVDALATRVVGPALQAGRLPTFGHLAERGVRRDECISIFPSITPAATASITTGCYPVDHGVAGAFWYDQVEDQIAYFGADIWVMLRAGLDQYLNDFLVRLNGELLLQPTLFERVERHGLTACVLNFMWFRGNQSHEVNAPLLFKLFPTFQSPAGVQGPGILALADFVTSKIPGVDEDLQATGGLQRRFGFHDATTAEYLLDLSKADPFPDFTLAYFPNNDFDSHEFSPAGAEGSLVQVDEYLRQFIDTRGGFDAFLDEFAIVICGDHSQGDLLTQDNGINLDALLDDRRSVPAGKPWQPDDEIMICPNLRAAHLYLRNRAAAERDQIVERLLSDSRIDQVMWQTSDPQVPGGASYCVAAADKGRMTFRGGDDNGSSVRDLHGNSWCIEGDLSSVDAKLSARRVIEYGDYPNALERIVGGFSATTDCLWATAKPGYEFHVNATSTNALGSHGALHAEDSTTPLLIAGAPDHLHIPDPIRSIDVAPICLEILGLDDEAASLRASRNAGDPSLPGIRASAR